jgi:hypothetical protein
MRPAALGLALLVSLLPLSAHARSERTLAYARDQVWPAAVRFVRVDERLKVTEKDADAGYLLFELHEDGKVFRGSLEIFAVTQGSRGGVRFVIQIEDRPSYLEVAMLERLERKLRAELGSPSPAPSRPPAKEPAKDPAKDPGSDPAPGDPGAPARPPTAAPAVATTGDH